jgi:hypothetical protein
MQESKHLPVNWADGMKINKSHFITQDNAVNCQLALTVSSLLNEFNYGLLSATGYTPGVKLFLSLDNQEQVQIRILQCRAITRGGHVIQFDEDTSLGSGKPGSSFVEFLTSRRELEKQGSEFYIVFSINPYQRIPFGLADISETPPRLPYARPSFDLRLMPVQGKDLLGLYQLPVGKLIIDAQKVVLDDAYIPPCCVINSHVELLELHAALEQFYSKMELYSLQIIQKIKQKKQSNEMAGIVQNLCENITIFTASQLTEIKNLSLYQPPIFLVNKVISMARLIKNTLDYYIGSGKEEFINYCNEWCNLIQGELEGTILELNSKVYNHLDINECIKSILQFTNVMYNLFSNLARLDYIGKRKDAGIFVKEKIVANETEPIMKHVNFLAD